MSLAIATIANSIAALTVSGLTIKDIDEIPQGLLNRDCPLLIPDPDNYISDFVIEVNSMGTGTDRKLTITYKLNYLLLYAQVGAGRTTTIEAYAGMVQKACDFLDAVFALSALTGAVDFDAELGDPQITTSGTTSFHSMGISMPIKEFVN